MLSVWEELSDSSKQALHWAGALARVRAHREGRPVKGVEADENDLLVGEMTNWRVQKISLKR